MADNAWSESTCRPGIWWYGVPGHGTWYWTARFGQYWVGGGVYQTYRWHNWECGGLRAPVKPYGWISEFGGEGQWFEGGAIVFRFGSWVVFWGDYGQTAGRFAEDPRPDDSDRPDGADRPPEHDEIVRMTATIGPDPTPEMLNEQGEP